MSCFDHRLNRPFAELPLVVPLLAAYDRHNQEIEFGLPSDLICMNGFETPAQF